MPFLLGMFGPFLQPSQKKHLTLIAENYAQKETVQTITTENGIVYTGYAHNELQFSDTIIPLPDNHGFFVGKLFDNHNFLPASFTLADAHTITQNPKIVMKKWWGRYAGALYNTTTQHCTLVRDPQGLSTLFYMIIGDSVIFSTDLSLLHDALEKIPSLNEAYFAEYIIGTNYASPLTPFNGILELLPGMGLHIQPNGSSSLEQLWNVSEYGGSFITDIDSFEHTLLTTMRSCLKAWVGDSSGVCLELSGGADSSGLMILLRDILPEHKNIIGVNYIDSKTPSSNEIVHAQEVADMCNAQLHFIDWQDASLLDPLPHAWRPNKPTTFLMFSKSRTGLKAGAFL
jgi:asparagine synthetase B (glutamine-hydrolysing)